MDTEPITEPAAQAGGNLESERPARQGWKPVLAIALVIAGLIAWGLFHGKARAAADSPAPATVAAARVARENLFNELTIPAEFRPYVEVELHAKVSGYVDKMNVDFGDKVKSGQLLATLEVPELQDELHNAMAMREKAEADYTNAHLMYNRLLTVNQDHASLVAPQELDTARSKDLSAAAAIAAARADAEKYQTLVKYTQISAPFDGVVTRRYADPGALIQAGTTSDTQSLPLVKISDNYHLRLDFQVSVQYVKDIHLGQLVTVRVDSLHGRTFTGKVTRFTDKVNEDTRTMPTEIEVANPDLEIVPGMYAAVALEVEQRPQVLVIPTQSVGGEKDPTVFVINTNHEIEARAVTLGLETPEKYEVISGLKEGEWVMIGNRSLVHPGQKVEAKLVSQLSMQ